MATRIYYAGTTIQAQDDTVVAAIIEQTKLALDEGKTRLISIGGGPDGEEWTLTVGAGIPLLIVSDPPLSDVESVGGMASATAAPAAVPAKLVPASPVPVGHFPDPLPEISDLAHSDGPLPDKW